MNTPPPPPASAPAPTGYDVAFLGAGISSTFTLVALLEGLESARAPFARLVLIDRDPDFFKGLPYGARSGDAGLIISRLADFLPSAHVAPFAEWLARDRERIFARFFALGGDGVEAWRRAYGESLEAGALDELYVPRYVVGLYFEHIARTAIARAEERGVASCETVVAEVVDLVQEDGPFTVIARDAAGQELRFHTHRVVLGLGSSPSQSLLGADAQGEGPVLIDDPFDPGIGAMLHQVRAAVRDLPARTGRVQIIGSNAGALDVIFNLMNDPGVAAGVGKVEVLSPSGRLPELFHTQQSGFRPSFVGHALKRLASHDQILADDIFRAVAEDIDAAQRDGYTITDTFGDISLGFISLLDRLSPAEKVRFACDTGPRIGALQRKVGHDYWGVLDALARDGRLTVTRGRYPFDDRSTAAPVVAIINCSGSARLSNPRLKSKLIRALLDRGWVRATGSDLGLAVNDDLETATPGLFVIGPMLTGNVIEGGPAWNLEHCGRIAGFGRRLAEHLIDRLTMAVPA